MYCPKCGTENAEGNKYCQKCGGALSAETREGGPAGAGGPGPAQSGPPGNAPGAGNGGTTSLQPNVAGLLCYLAWWITGLIFILIEKENKFVRFHAMQSIVASGALTVLLIMLQVIAYSIWLFWILYYPVAIMAFVLWIVLMVKAYQGQKFKLPIVGDLAEKWS